MKYMTRIVSSATAALLIAALGFSPRWAAGTAPTVSPPAVSAPAVDTADELAEIMVEAREPRFVAPTRRDQIGRIWAPVLINGRGPFRLVLDTGASSSGVTAMVALALGIPTDQSPPVMLRGVTGSATVPTIRVDTLSVGDLAVDSPLLPIVPDALGGAEGILGSEGLTNKRIFIDFRHDQIVITYSRDERSGRDFVSVPFRSIRGQLIVVNAIVGDVRTKAIIDTGGQTTIGNLALRCLGPAQPHLSRQTRPNRGCDPGRAERRTHRHTGDRTRSDPNTRFRRDVCRHVYLQTMEAHERARHHDRDGRARYARYPHHRLPSTRIADAHVEDRLSRRARRCFFLAIGRE
jgi:hypothetical protein